MPKKIIKSNVQDVLKLNTVQLGMFYTYFKEQDSNVMNIQVAINVHGEFDEIKLKTAIDLVVKRNEALRSVFRWEDLREPIQIILNYNQPHVDVYDFSEFVAAQLQKEIDQTLYASRTERFDISETSVRFTIIKSSKNYFILCITNHHILYDGWSTGVIFKEILEIYEKSLHGEIVALPEKKVYKSFLQHGLVSTKETEYWRYYLKGVEVVNWYTQQIRNIPTGDRVRKKTVVYPLQRLEEFCKKHKVTIAEVIYSVHGILLSKLRDAEDLIFGVTVSSRDSSVAGFNDVVGNFISVVPVRYKGHREHSLLDVVLKIHNELLERNEYNKISYYEVKKLLNVGVGKDLFDSAVVIENYPIDKIITNGTDLFSIEMRDFHESIDIPLVVNVTLIDKLKLDFAYNAKLIDEAYINSFSDSYVTLLNELLEQPHSIVKSVGLIHERDQVALLKTGSSAFAGESNSLLVPDLLQRQFTVNLEKVAIVVGNTEITYRDLQNGLSKVAGLLHEVYGIKKGELIGVMMHANQYLIMGLLGILKLGACFVPIDPRLSEERKKSIINDSGVRLILSEGNNNIDLGVNVEVIDLLKEVDCEISYRHPENVQIAGDDLCYIIYTSGSTGVPKGVMIEHKSLSNYLQWAAGCYIQDMEAVFPLFTSISFDLTITSIFLPLMTGNQLIIYDYQRPEFAIEQIFADRKANVIKLTPSHLRLIKSLNIEKVKEIRNVIKFIVGGEELENELAKNISEIFSGNVEIYNEYGPTEATVGCMVYKYNIQQSDYFSVPIGEPIANTAVYILDNNRTPVPVGVLGELYISGIGLSKGYLNDERQSQDKFVINPFGDYPLMYKSGDLVVRNEKGDIFFKGRTDSQVKIQGYRIELDEIKTHIRRFENVNDVAVKVWKDGEDKYIAAYLVSKQIEFNELRSFLAKYLPDYMIPRYFVLINEIPLTVNGKVDIDSLPKPQLEKSIDDTSLSDLEVELIEILAAALKTNTDKIGHNKSFFDLGVDSLRAIIFVNTILKKREVRISIQELFENDNIRNLASFIEQQEITKFQEIPVAKTSDYYHLSYSQKRLFFLHKYEPTSTAYNGYFISEIRGKLDIGRFENALRQLVARHESLRTYFTEIDGSPYQIVAHDIDLEIEYVKTDKNDLPTVIKSFIKPFDLEILPLFRVGLVEIDINYYVLFFDIHHIVSDGVSQQLLIGDFLSYYQDKSLPPLRIQYKDYAVWHNEIQTLKPDSTQKAFWLKQYAEEVPKLNLPIDFLRPAAKSYEGATIEFEIDELQVANLRSIASDRGCTLFVLLLSSYYILMSKISNQEDIVVGTPVSGRDHSDVEGIVGMFVNTLPIRILLKDDLSINEFITKVKNAVLACFENQTFSYEELIDSLKLERDASRNPLFDVLFVLDNFDPLNFNASGLSFHPYSIDGGKSKFDITLTVKDVGERLFFSLEYCTDLFVDSSIERFAAYYKQIISYLIEGDRNEKISNIEVVPPEEKTQLLFAFNNTDIDFDKDRTIIDFFEDQVERVPDKLAVAFEGRELTFSMLSDQVNILASYLRNAYDIQPNDFVGIMVERSEYMLIGLLAILKSGGAYVPIDPTYPQSRKEFILENSKARVLLTQEKYAQDIEYSGHVEFLPYDFQSSSTNTGNPKRINNASDLCYMIYTSGSTGQPKGVMVRHRNVCSFFLGMDQHFALTGKDKMLATTSMSFDISVLELLWPICRGVAIEIHSADAGFSDFDRYVAEEKPVVDFSLFFFANYNPSDEKNKHDLLLKSVLFADQAGFKSVWTPERHFHEFGGLYPNPSIISSALAMLTRQIQLRAGSVVLPLHDSIDVANEWSAIDNFSGGRVGLAFASGWNPNDFALSKSAFEQRREVMFSEIENIKKLWRGEEIRLNGTNETIQIAQKPVQKDVQIWITAAGSDETFRQAGSSGVNILTHLLGQDMEELSRKINVYRTARREAGHSGPGTVSLMVHAFIEANITDVEAIVEKPFIEYLKSHIGLSKIVFNDSDIADDEELSPELEEKILRNAFERYYKTSSLIGTKSTTIGLVQKLIEIGVNEICCLIDFGIDKKQVLDSLSYLKELKELFSSENSKKSQQPVSILQSTPSFLKVLEADPRSKKFLKSLRYLLVGGESLPSTLLKKLWLSCNGTIYNMYGPTETTVWSSVKKFIDNDQVTIGTPIANTQMYVLDRNLDICPIGVTGDLYIGGEGVSKGYWRQKELTNDRFIVNPFRKESHIYRTGDLARWLPSGELMLSGREDDQVKIRGFRIELGEIESHLLEYSHIDEVVTVARGSENEQYIVAYYVSDHKLEIAGLRHFLLERLPEYMVPSFFLRIEKLPLTPNGKIDKKTLPEPKIEKDKLVKAPETKEELLLTKIWSDVLGIKEISVRDNFFALGGDSIKSIQISARAREAGYDLKVKDIFMSQNIEQLASGLRSIHTYSDQNLVVGKGILSPIQHWFYDSVHIDPAHYNQSVMLDFPNGISKDLVLQIFRALLMHHDALRLVFEKKEQHITSTYTDGNLSLFVEEVDLTGVPDYKKCLLDHASTIQSGIDLENGPLVNLGLFHLQGRSFLLVAIHHLVIDGISWRILFEDIECLYKQAINGIIFKLPLKTDSYKTWATHLKAYLATPAYENAKEYWKHIVAEGADIINRDYEYDTNRVKDQLTESFNLNKVQTDKLLGPVHQPFNTQINDILLAALFIAVNKKYGNKSLYVDLEGHGREQINEKVSIARTVGWFSSIYAIRLEDGGSLGGTIKTTKEIFRNIPNNGIDYLLCKYYDKTAAKEIFNDKTNARIFFNYLGQFDADTHNRSFSVSMESTGEVVSTSGVSNYDWEILGIVSDEELQLRLTYSKNQYSRTTVSGVMSLYKEVLTEIIDYCCSMSKKELTPSDLTYKQLPISLLESLQNRYEVENIYPLSPMQEGLLFYSLHDDNSDQYFNQIGYKVSGNLDLETMKCSIEHLIAKYDVLRTVYPPNDFKRPLQVVLRNQPVDFIFKDITKECKAGTINQVVGTYQLLDRKNKFDLSENVLRVSVLQTGVQQYQVIWSYHHILMDGWCIGIILQEFKEIYKRIMRGEEYIPVEKQTYSKYIEWLEKRDKDEVREYWKNKLIGYETLATLPFSRNFPDDNIEYKLDSEVITLDENLVYSLGKLSKLYQVTVNNVILTAWGILLAKYNNINDVVFGSIVSGRPAEIPGIETMVGLFMNMIPVRVTYEEGESVIDLLQKVQQDFFNSEPFQYHSLADIQSQSSLGRSLFDHFFVFENYPIQSQIKEQVDENDFKIEDVDVFEQSNYDYSITVVPGEVISIRFDYNSNKFDERLIKNLTCHFKNLLELIIADEQLIVSKIDVLTEEEKQLIIEGFNNTAQETYQGETINSLFESRVRDTPNEIAVIYENYQLSYLQLDEKANELARLLRNDFNICNKSLVGIVMDRSELMLISILAVLKAGGAYVPIDASYPKERIAYILQDCHSSLVITNKELEINFEGEVLHVEREKKYSEAKGQLPSSNSSSDLCYVIYTSGSTGKPKGVMISHENVLNFFSGMNAQLGCGENESLLAVTSISFDISVLELLWTLCHGVQVVIHPSDISLSGLDRYVDENNHTMDFSLFFFANYNYEQNEDKYNLLLKSAKYADQHGFNAVWTPERHFHEFGGLYPNPSIISSALAASTDNLILRSGSVVSPLHDIVDIAQEWMTVDNLSNGRTGLSFVAGWNPNDFVLSNEAFNDRHEVMYSQIELIKSLWHGEVVQIENEKGEMAEFSLNMQPVKKDLSVWVTAAGSEKTFKRAGEIGANLLTHLLGQDVDELKTKIAIYQDARKEAGFNKGKVAVMLHTFIGEDIQEVKQIVEQPFKEYLKSSIGLSKVIFEEAGLNESEISDDFKETILSNSFRRYFSNSSLLGTKASACEMVQKLKLTGVDEIACLIDFGVDEHIVFDSLVHLKELVNLFSKERVNYHKPITMMQSTPSFMKLLKSDSHSQKFLKTLKTVLVGGEPLKKNLANDLIESMGADIYNMYGPTETTIWSTMSSYKNKIDTVDVGKPIANTSIYILSKEFNPLPVGVPGEVYIGGLGVSKGYWNKPELTHSRFLNSPFKNGEKIYKTGDIGRWLPDGNIQLIGREDHQVKIRGHRIELGEIESCLLLHENVKQVVVDVYEDLSDSYIVAYFTSKIYIEFEVLREHLSQFLPYYMIPTYFVHMEAIPLTPNKKVDRSQLPDPKTTKSDNVSPSTNEEKLLAEIWTDTLGITNVSITDNFFSIGGDSIKSIQVVRKIYSEFGLKINISKMFQYQTVRELASFIQKTEGHGISRISASDEKKYYNLSAAQLSVYMAVLLNDPVAYNIPFIVKIEKKHSLDRIEQIFKQLIERHDSLKTSIKVVDNIPRQIIHKKVDFKITEQAIIDGDTTGLVREFDLERAPLVKVFNLKTDQSIDYHYILVDIHHIVSDGESLILLRRELNSLLRGELLDEVDIQYKDFTEWQRRYRETQNIISQQEFWKKEMAILKPTYLPTDFAKSSSSQRGVSAVFDFEVYRKNIAKLRQFIYKRNVSLSIYLLSIYKVLIHKITQSEDVIVGFTTSGRTLPELERLVGLLANILPIRTYPSASKGYVEYLYELKQKYNDVFANQDLQLSEIISLAQTKLNESTTVLPTVFTLNIDYKSEYGEDEFADVLPEELGIELNITSKFDIFIDVTEASDTIAISINYNKELFTLDSIRTMSVYFNEIIDQTLSDTEIKIEAILPTYSRKSADVVSSKFDESQFNFD